MELLGLELAYTGSAADVLWYQEEHTVKTNLNGLAYLTIGSVTPPLFGNMSGIDWSKGPFYIKSETDPIGGKKLYVGYCFKTSQRTLCHLCQNSRKSNRSNY